MRRAKYYVYLHLCILIFSLTEIFGKFAANTYKSHGLYNFKLYIFLVLMLFVCVLYAFCWQKIIKHFELHTAYANRAMYLVWSQVWASAVFSEVITPKNILGMLIVMTGVILVSTGDSGKESDKGTGIVTDKETSYEKSSIIQAEITKDSNLLSVAIKGNFNRAP